MITDKWLRWAMYLTMCATAIFADTKQVLFCGFVLVIWALWDIIVILKEK